MSDDRFTVLIVVLAVLGGVIDIWHMYHLVVLYCCSTPILVTLDDEESGRV